jgi:integrase/recombinase XerD
MQEGAVHNDPTEFLVSPKQWATLPKYLNGEELDRLFATPSPDSATGIRDRSMLELLYATGLRVSEVCGLPLAAVEREMGVLKVTGKGRQQTEVGSLWGGG